jgi:cbb3-type cytochrome oxidase subunit 3
MDWSFGIFLSLITLSGWIYLGKINLKPAYDAQVKGWYIQLAVQVPWWLSCAMIGDWYRAPNTLFFTVYFVVMIALIYRARARQRAANGGNHVQLALLDAKPYKGKAMSKRQYKRAYKHSMSG